ncbi:hypothetical protein CBS14141_002126 [Malassezia furfur]|nr:hypothetical protein CBS14141_002126 [Malassezia furfur]
MEELNHGTPLDSPPSPSTSVPRHMEELTARLIAQAQQLASAESERNGDELDSTTAASLETFMASLKAHLQLPSSATAEHSSVVRERWHKWSEDERRTHVQQAIRRLLRSTSQRHDGPLTTVRCLHASVAQKSYGTEKRFLCPPPTVEVTGPLRYCSDASPVFSMHIHSEDGEHVTGEQRIPLDETRQARFNELHVTGTGKAKSFRLQLHLASRNDAAAREAKRARLLTEAPEHAWANFESAPIGIISKPSKKSAKARHASAHITSNASVSLFNRINSQTYRTKYLSAHGARLSAQSRAWTAFRLVPLARPAEAQTLDIDPDVLTYGSTIVLVDEASGVTTDPLVVCKVDRGRILPPYGTTRITLDDGTVADESYLYGAVSQMQKIALLRHVASAHQGAGEWEMDVHTPRMYLCAGMASIPSDPSSPFDRTSPAGLTGDAQVLPLTYAASKATAWADSVVLDDAEDAFCWTLVGISHFAYSFIDTDLLDVPHAPPDAGLVLTPFPIVTSMPFYDTQTHKLAMCVQHMTELIDDGRPGTQAPTKEIWLGPLGPLTTLVAPVPERPDEAEVVVDLPPLRRILEQGGESDTASQSQLSLPLLFVRSSDGAIYHSGRQILCQDLVAVVRAAGDHRAADALKKLQVGLGAAAGADELPPGSVWTIRVL